MMRVRNEDIELMQEINKKLKDPRIEAMISRWLKGRDANRKEAREGMRKRREK